MAENETPIALPEQTDELEGVLTGAVRPKEQAANQHIEPGETATAPADAPGTEPDSAPLPDRHGRRPAAGGRHRQHPLTSAGRAATWPDCHL